MELWFGWAIAKLFLIKSNVADNPSTGGHEKYVSVFLRLFLLSRLSNVSNFPQNSSFSHPRKLYFFILLRSSYTLNQFSTENKRRWENSDNLFSSQKEKVSLVSILNVWFSLKKIFFSSACAKGKLRKLLQHTKEHTTLNTFVSRKTRNSLRTFRRAARHIQHEF